MNIPVPPNREIVEVLEHIRQRIQDQSVDLFIPQTKENLVEVLQLLRQDHIQVIIAEQMAAFFARSTQGRIVKTFLKAV